MKIPSSSRIIGADRLSGVRRFTLTDLADGGVRTQPANPYEGDPAYIAGREQGLRDGFRQGADAARQKIAQEQGRQQATIVELLNARAAQITSSLAEQLGALEQSVADELVDLAIELARQTVRQSLKVDRDAVVAVVQEAVAALTDERASFSIHLNPSDAEHVRDTLAPILAARQGRLVPDPRIASGGCRVVSAGAEIDSTVGTRWRRVLASIGREAPADDPLCDA